MCGFGYARFLTRYPHVVLTAVLLLAGTCLVISLTLGEGFSFNDPLAGFEPRGTDISDRLVAFENLLDDVGGRTNLFPFSQPHIPVKDLIFETTLLPLPTLPLASTSRHRRETDNDTVQATSLFCGIPDKKYSRVVVTSSKEQSLFNVEDLQAMCSFEKEYFRESSVYKEQCIREGVSGSCCTAWSLGSYVALISGKQSCDEITQTDVKKVLRLLKRCAPYFHNYTLLPNCHSEEEEWFYSIEHPSSSCPEVPKRCKTYNAVYHMLHFLSDSEFISKYDLPKKEKSERPFLTFATVFLPLVDNVYSTNVFLHLDNLPRQFKSLKVVGAYFGVKYSLFQKYLIMDSVWLSAAFGVIFIIMWIYTTSVFITSMTFLSMLLAVQFSYFLYTFVFKIHFFPYMNMVTLIVMLGIGADDLFIYCKVWQLAKAERNDGVLEKLTSNTLKHTALSMMVTSLTTAAAFYANFISDISSIRCFSLFAGTTMLINFLLTITWLPASVLVYEKWFHCCISPSDQNFYVVSAVCKFPIKLYDRYIDMSRIFFEKLLPCLVIKLRFLWIVVFGGLWIASIIIVFYYPGLTLPNTEKFQVFASSHLLEKYELELADKFNFEHVKDGDDLPVFPVSVVWGVHPTDNGDPLDPYNKGTLSFDSHFDLTSQESQKWILKFCSSLRRTDFFLPSSGLLPTDCFLENFVHGFMTQPCMDDNLECCNQTEFPFQKSKMMACLSQYIPSLKSTPLIGYNDRSPGPRFDKGRLSAFFVQFLSNVTFTYSFEETHSFYQKVNYWVNEQMRDAPPEMRNGWFISHLHFYDLQSSLASGTPLSLGVSLCVVAVVSFFTTLNVLISLYALLTVAAAISLTLASLVLMDWKLDVLESIVITVAIGLAIDLTLHYGVAFRLAPDSSREMRVINSLGRMGSPVTMAAMTTIVAGAFMMPSTVLVYRKFGTFLLLLVTAAWLYATFFFMSLLRLLGPHGGFGQFHWPVVNCFSAYSREHRDKTSYALSESTLSTSSAGFRDYSHCGEGDQDVHRLSQYPKNIQYVQGDGDIDQRRGRRHQSHRHIYHRPRRKGEYASVHTEESTADKSDGIQEEVELPESSLILNPQDDKEAVETKPHFDSSESEPITENLFNNFKSVKEHTNENHDDVRLKDHTIETNGEFLSHPLSVT